MERIITVNEWGEIQSQNCDPITFDQMHPRTKRLISYSIGEQLNCLYDDIEAGVFGEAAKTGKFATYVKSIKQAYPKE